MKQPDPNARLAHMLDSARLIREWLRGVSRDQYDTNLMMQSALVHQIQIIGEAAAKLDQTARDSIAEIPWKQVIGMRHVLVHDYMSVDADIVWEVSKHRIPELIEALEKALEI